MLATCIVPFARVVYVQVSGVVVVWGEVGRVQQCRT